MPAQWTENRGPDFMGTLSEREEDFFKGPQGPGNQRGLPQALGLKLPDSDWGTQLRVQEEAHLNIFAENHKQASRDRREADTSLLHPGFTVPAGP